MTQSETFFRRLRPSVGRERAVLLCSIVAAAALSGLVGARAAGPSTATAGAAQSVERTVVLTEGTNMAASASRDGQTLALAVQGRLWTVPVAGGDARGITGWETEATYPTWSPDGSRIAFQNYSPDGFYHVWTVARDGSDPRPVTSGAFDDREPAWSPDGTRIAFASDRAGSGSYDVWTVEVGSGALERRTSGSANENYPAWSPDGTRVAYSSGRTIAAVDAGGQVSELAAVPEGETGPAVWTRDGTGVVYLNNERQVVVGGAPATTGEDVFPFPVSFLPDGGFVYTANGRLRIRDAQGNVRDVPFRAALALDRPAPTPNKDHRLDAPEPRQVQGVFAPVLSPDGKNVAFVALNDLWVMPIGQRPERLTNDISVEWVPSWSPDGRAIYFSSDRESPAHPDMYAIDLASRAVRRISVTPNSRMIFPSLSPDGRSFVYVDGANESLRIHDIASGESRLLVNRAYASNIGKPAWSPDGRKIVVADIQRANSQYREGRNLIRIVDVASGKASFVEPAPSPDGLSERFEAGPAWSPDGRWLAFVMTGTLHVMPVTPEGVPTGPARQVAPGAADMPTWASDSRTILYLSSGRLRTVQLDGSGGRDLPVDLTWRPAVPPGSTVIHAGALWDGVRPELQRNVEITLTGGRIASVRPITPGAAEAAKTSGARLVDATGLTVMPGLWDAHVHPRAHDMTAQWWAVQLAYGITDVISNGASTYQSVMQKEALATGQLVGPRLFAGAIFDGPRPFYGHHRAVKDPAVLRIELDKARAMDMDFLKAYVRAPATFMRMISQAGSAMGVVSGSHFLSPGIEAGLSGTTHLSATQRMGYGWSESEGGKSYQDVIALYAQTDFALVSHHSQGNNVLGDEPGIATDPRFTLLMPEQYVRGFRTQAATPPTPQQREAMREDVAAPAAILRAGGLVTIGTDSPLAGPGLGVHARLRSFATGVTNHQALQAVTINAARYARADRELGTVEAGKIADLIFVRGDPLANVAAAANVAIVMKNGIVHTADEILRPFR